MRSTADPRRNVIQATLTDSELADLKKCCEETMTPVSSRVRALIVEYVEKCKRASKPAKK